MDVTVKSPYRINVTKKVRDLVSKIDKIQYFGLQDSMISRSELFLFAMAIGAEAVPTKLENINPGGLVLENSIDSRTKSLMYALFIKNLENKDLDTITQKDAVYNMAQEYANTGFEIIDDYISKKKDTELIWDFLEELDVQYNMVVTAP